MPYVWYINVTYTDGSQMCLRYPDTDGGQEAFNVYMKRVADERKTRELIDSGSARPHPKSGGWPLAPRVLSVTQPYRVYEPTDTKTEPVFTKKGLII
jgi:hypothetical protein